MPNAPFAGETSAAGPATPAAAALPATISHAPKIEGPSDLAKLSLAALGVVYGDIGTSPLYAIRECFTLPHGVAVTRANVLGVESLFFWSMTLVIVVKYLTFIMRADNHGEGGILALLALLKARPGTGPRSMLLYVTLGLFGTALLYGDGIITPAISVLGAMEGLGTTDTSYFLGRETLVITHKPAMARWRKVLFAFMSRNARPANAFFQIPPGRVVELGAQIEL